MEISNEEITEALTEVQERLQDLMEEYQQTNDPVIQQQIFTSGNQDYSSLF